MQLPGKSQTSSHMVIIMVVKGNAALDVARDLPTRLRFLEDERLIDSEIAGDFLRIRLTRPTDNLVRPNTGMAIHVIDTPA